MSDNAPTSAHADAAAVPEIENAASTPLNASVNEADAASPTKVSGDASTSPDANGSDSDPDASKDGENAEDGDAKPKRRKPYLNKNRFMTGGPMRDKPPPEELAERMERIRLNNEKIKERRAVVQADEQAFEASQTAQRAAQRAKTAATRKIQTEIDTQRAANAKRKMERLGVREWDSFKKGAATETGTNASMHAPPTPDSNDNINESEVKEGSLTPMRKTSTSEQAQAQAPLAGSESGRSAARGRGAGRARSRGRGGRGGVGGGGGRGGGETRRERAPHTKDAPQDNINAHGADDGGWGAAAEEWGTTSITDASQTGIAITTNEADPWGTSTGPADDPWGVAHATEWSEKS